MRMAAIASCPSRGDDRLAGGASDLEAGAALGERLAGFLGGLDDHLLAAAG